MKKIEVYINSKNLEHFFSDELKEIFIPNWECEDLHHLGIGRLKLNDFLIDIIASMDIPESTYEL